jgi:hypothetical protein
VQRRDVDAMGPQRCYHWVDFIAGENEVAGDRGLAVIRRWKPMPMATPIGPTGASSMPPSVTGSRRGTWNW